MASTLFEDNPKTKSILNKIIQSLNEMGWQTEQRRYIPSYEMRYEALAATECWIESTNRKISIETDAWIYETKEIPPAHEIRIINFRYDNNRKGVINAKNPEHILLTTYGEKANDWNKTAIKACRIKHRENGKRAITVIDMHHKWNVFECQEIQYLSDFAC